MVAIMLSNPGVSNKCDVDPLSNSDSKSVQIFSFAWEADHSPPICMESVSSAVLKYQHLPCDCEWKSHNSEGVFGQLYTDAYASELRVKMRYSVFHTQLHHDSHQVYRNLDVSCTIVEILWLAKYLVWRKLGREVTKRRGVSKSRPVLWSSPGRRVPACIHGFLWSSPISIVESDVTCLSRPFERFVYDMHSHK